MKHYWVFTFLILLVQPHCMMAQVKTEFHKEISFINHLVSRNSYQEALYLLEKLETEIPQQKDSLNYLSGWILYNQKALEASTFYLRQVSTQSPHYAKSNFFAAYNLSYLNRTNESLSLLANFDTLVLPVQKSMVNFQKAGISLLDRRLDDFSGYADSFQGSYSVMAREEERLKGYHINLLERPKKSPVVAGLLSATIPGLGKMYAGKSSEGISSLLYVGAMMATSLDFYNRMGPQNPFFIISASITSIFYIGNIWGSVTSVNRIKQEFDYEIDQRILLDMHIPLRNLFP